MEEEALVEAAIQYAQQNNWNRQDYTFSSVRRVDETAQIFFDGKSGRPGDHFSVWVDSNTGEVIRLVPGR